MNGSCLGICFAFWLKTWVWSQVMWIWIWILPLELWLWASYLTFLYLSSIICESCDSSSIISSYLQGISSKALHGYPSWQIPKSLIWNNNTVSPPSPMVLQIQRAASLIAQLVKNLPAMQETLVWFLGQEDPLEKG